MSLTERLSQAPKGRGHYCTLGKLLATLPLEHKTEERDALLGALVNPDWTGTAIHRALADEGHLSVELRHLTAHRRGECTTASCPMPLDGVRR